MSNQKFDDCLDLSLTSNNFVSHYVYIKDFNRFMFNKTKHKGKKYFCKSCLQCFSSDKMLKKHKEDCLMINGKKNVKLEKEFISFKKYSRQKYLFHLKFILILNIFLKKLMILVLIMNVFYTQKISRSFSL